MDQDQFHVRFEAPDKIDSAESSCKKSEVPKVAPSLYLFHSNRKEGVQYLGRGDGAGSKRLSDPISLFRSDGKKIFVHYSY
jgi:hypothetical protein